MAADSIPRKIIEYLQATLPASNKSLQFDAVALRHSTLPACVINACPGIPEVRAGGNVDVNTRNLKLYVTLLWGAGASGRNYDEFEACLHNIVDAMADMQGTATLGNAVLRSEVSVDDSSTSLDIDTQTYIADLEIMVTFTRPRPAAE